ncbi:MAG: heparinase II/III family protein, partial [Alphaproteobacteria bacterium]
MNEPTMTQPSDGDGGPRPLEGFAWLADRLAAMGPAEIAFRFGEHFKRTVSRFYQPDFKKLTTGPLDPPPCLAGLSDGLNALADETKLREGWRALAEQMRRGRFRALGATWPDHAGPPDWHLDPSTGTTWPSQTYCFDIPYRYAPERGDIKFALELNRLQYLQPMAAAAALDGDDELAALVVGHLDSWIAENPPYRSVSWLSGIELALRVVSLLVVATLIGRQSFSSEFRQRLHLCLAAHGYWPARFPSRYSSANNHRIAEAGALCLLGRLVPTLREAAAWARDGRVVLEQELALQFHDDGVGAEQSPTYGAFSLEWFLLCATVGGRAGDDWSNASWHRMAQAGHHPGAITDCKGNQPRIGDDDEGRVLFSLPGPEEHVNTVLGYLAAAAKKPELALPNVTPHLGQAMFGRAAPARRKNFEYTSFPAGGYTAV